ncbi:MFS transporter [Hamadaea sp. NPDC051192]|uniref:MFS transporter n=1 Tax=Hamadaea sp. NPDC051192 TaxID=3154940 RepID=UPI00341A9261
MTTTLAPETPTPTRKSWIPRLLRERQFRRFWTGQTISLFGDQISGLALPLLAVLGAGASAAEMGYLTAAGLLPSLLFSLLAGAWVDRRPIKRRIMIAADLGRAALLLAIPLLYALSLLTMPQLYLVAFGVGTLSVLFEVCRTTLFVSLVGKESYLEANSLLNGARAMSYVAGPSAGGVLVQVLTAPVALIADAVSYLFSGLLLARIQATEPPPSTTPGLGLGEGLRFLWRSRLLRMMLAGSTTLNLFNYMFSALIILYAATTLGISPGVLGLVLGIASIGALLGAAVASRLAQRIGVGPALILGYVLFPAPLLLMPAASGSHVTVLVMLTAAEFLSGAGVMILDICSGSIQTAAVPDELRARVSGAHRTVNYGIRPIGAVLGGALGTLLGVHTTLWVSAIGGVLAVGWLLVSPLPKMRTLADA